MTTLGVFAVAALILGAIGIYGVMAYGVAQRRREIAIRIALGARSSEGARSVVRQGMTLTAAGLFLGFAGAWWGTRVMEGLLYGVGSRDAVIYVAGAGVLALAALCATWIPARQATRVDPMAALRGE